MSDSTLFKFTGGVSAILTGILLATAHIINLLANAEHGTAWGPLLAFLGHLVAVFALVGIYEAQGQKNGRLGVAGFLLSMVGTVALCAVIYIDIVASYGVDVGPLSSGLIPRMLILLSPLIFGLGVLLLAASLIRARVFSRWGAYALILGILIFGVGSELGIATPIMAVVGAAALCIGFTQIGGTLLAVNPGRVFARLKSSNRPYRAA